MSKQILQDLLSNQQHVVNAASLSEHFDEASVDPKVAEDILGIHIFMEDACAPRLEHSAPAEPTAAPRDDASGGDVVVEEEDAPAEPAVAPQDDAVGDAAGDAAGDGVLSRFEALDDAKQGKILVQVVEKCFGRPYPAPVCREFYTLFKATNTFPVGFPDHVKKGMDKAAKLERAAVMSDLFEGLCNLLPTLETLKKDVEKWLEEGDPTDKVLENFVSVFKKRAEDVISMARGLRKRVRPKRAHARGGRFKSTRCKN